MKNRQKQLLRELIAQYVKTAQPVASSLLVDKLGEPVSSATIRAEMAELEKDGFIIQPHTSAGRIPTEKGYCFFVDNFLETKNLNVKERNKILKVVGENFTERETQKNLAKVLAEISGETVILAFEKNDIYYTGLTNLFSKPEFENKELVMDISSVIDHLDSVIFKIFDASEKVDIRIGSDCEFSGHCSSVVAKLNNFSLLAMIGPIRMDYQKNFELINFVSNIKE
jgi:transcriptional regulator of heat shock response